MIGYTTYLNQNVTVIKLIDSGIGAGNCLVLFPNNTTNWLDYRQLGVINWVILA